MSQRTTIEVARRTETRKNANRRLRQAGRIPGVLYGLDRPPFPVSVDPKRVDEVLRTESGRNTLFTLALTGEDKTRAAMFKELQRHPVTGRLLHVDFIRVDLERKVTVRVPVNPVGTPLGVKNEGGILDFIQRDLEVECLPDAIPEHLDVDVSGLHIGQNVSAADIEIRGDFRIVDEPETILVTVAAPRKEVEAVEVAEEEAAPEEGAEEPEVAKKGKEAAEGEAASGEKSD